MCPGVVEVQFTNGVGNNIFQYVYGKLVAEAQHCGLRHKALPVLGVSEEKASNHSKLTTKNIRATSYDPINYHDLLVCASPRNYTLHLFPEDFTLYTTRIEKIRGWFEDAPTTNTKDLVLHLRLGDRLVLKGCFKEQYGPTPAEDYVRGIESFDFDRLHIVTDMPIWEELTVKDIPKLMFHCDPPAKKRVDPKISADYFNSLFHALNEYAPVVRFGNSVEDDFRFMRGFSKIMFQHSTLAWWAAALSHAEDVALYGRWRGGKEINLGWTDLPGWRQWGPKTAPPRAVKEMNLMRFAQKHNLRVLVETGTRGGTMLKNIGWFFKKMYSVEIVEAAYNKVSRKFQNDPRIELFLGDSAKKIGPIVKKLDQPALFWLDAHDGRNSTPIMQELEQILALRKHPHVLVIDDSRYFGTEKAYPTIDEVVALVKAKEPKAVVKVQFDSICIQLPRIGA